MTKLADGTGAPSGRLIWSVATVLVVVLGVAVPYGLLAGAAPGLGLVVFWLGFGLAVMLLVAIGVMRWRTGN